MRINIFLICLFMTTLTAGAQNFKTTQQGFKRVKDAYAQKWPALEADLKKAGFKTGYSMFLRAFKEERTLEVWLKNKDSKSYTLFRTYNFCQRSGTLGPKLQSGDLQTPEGVYYINVFNPESSFHLSLGINYPNSADLVRSKGLDPGNDIYIHGNCVTVGCIPITDELIKELYVLAVESRNNGQERIPVHIFPFKMTDANLKKFSGFLPQHAAFWACLQKEYAYFNDSKNTR